MYYIINREIHIFSISNTDLLSNSFIKHLLSACQMSLIVFERDGNGATGLTAEYIILYIFISLGLSIQRNRQFKAIIKLKLKIIY